MEAKDGTEDAWGSVAAWRQGMEFLRQVQTIEYRRRLMKMDAAMWNVVLFNLCEAHGDLRAMCAEMAYLDEGKTSPEWEGHIQWRKGSRGFTPSHFEVGIEHVYHHVNFAWNCRHAGAERAWRCASRDFNRWEKFPKDWPELWPPPERCRERWPKHWMADWGWRTVHAAAMRGPLEEAEDTLDLLIDGVFLRLGDDLDPMRRRPEKLREDAWAVTERDFGVLIRRFYRQFNAAWNARKRRKPVGEKKRNCCFPREIVRYWPESGMLPKFGRGSPRGGAEGKGRSGKRENPVGCGGMRG